MSTQASIFPPILFSITTPQQSFRLLELPAELLELLTSDDKPTTLDLKSSPPLNDKLGMKASSEYLHLCTSTKSWAVRQVSTSNSVYVTCPASNEGSGDPSTPGNGVTAISKPTSHLELISTAPSPTEIKAAIVRLLPIHASAESPPSSPSITSEALINSLPFPRYLITLALRSLFAFSTSPHKNLLIPSSALLISSWKLLTQHTAILKIRLDDPDRLGFENIAENVLMDEGSNSTGRIYFAIIQAIINEFTNTTDQVEDGREMTEQEREEFSTSGPLKAKELTIFVGQLLVRCAGAKGIEKQNLLEEWSKLLPLSWEKHCDISNLGEQYKLAEEADGTQLVWHVHPAPTSATSAVGLSSTPAAAATGKRKWHEKFAARRNQKQ